MSYSKESAIVIALYEFQFIVSRGTLSLTLIIDF